MSLATIIQSLVLFAQASQPTVYELPLPKGKQIDISREYGVKEQVLMLNSDSVKDMIYLRVSDEGFAAIVDYKQDGKVDYVFIVDGIKNETREYSSKNKNDSLAIKKAGNSLKDVMDFLSNRQKK